MSFPQAGVKREALEFRAFLVLFARAERSRCFEPIETSTNFESAGVLSLANERVDVALLV